MCKPFIIVSASSNVGKSAYLDDIKIRLALIEEQVALLDDTDTRKKLMLDMVKETKRKHNLIENDY